MPTQLQRSQFAFAQLPLLSITFVLCASATMAADKPTSSDQQISGEEIFRREWIANDPRSHGGDGLGPVFNESSCVACHNQGGVGGGGSREKNVHLLTFNMPDLDDVKRRLSQHGARTPETTREIEKFDKDFRKALTDFHPDFRKSKTVVVHRFGIELSHIEWLEISVSDDRTAFSTTTNQFSFQIQSGHHPHPGSILFGKRISSPSFSGLVSAHMVLADAIDNPIKAAHFGARNPRIANQVTTNPKMKSASAEIMRLKSQADLGISLERNFGLASILSSQRNTTALFGAGLIDSISGREIETAAARQHKDFPAITGRIHRLKNNRIGRFGWKAQEASLYDFTMAACGVELGLHVPDHPQSIVPYHEKYKPTGYDLNQQEAGALVEYIGQLPRPVQQQEPHPEIAKHLAEGASLFEATGCAACHIQKLGPVDGLFSDLLLHDMGPDLVSPGSGYSGPSFRLPSNDHVPLAKTDKDEANQKPQPPTAREWRTPPLWGVRDSAPYLHDGRAATLEQAIAFHGGEAADARLRFFMQPHEKRQKIITFLKSLVAPSSETSER